MIQVPERWTAFAFAKIFRGGLAFALDVPEAHISRIVPNEVPRRLLMLNTRRLLRGDSKYFDVDYDVIVPEGMPLAVMSAKVASLTSGAKTLAAAESFRKYVEERDMLVKSWDVAPPAASFSDEEIFVVNRKTFAFVAPKYEFITNAAALSQDAEFASGVDDTTTRSSMLILVIICCLLLLVAMFFCCAIRWCFKEKPSGIALPIFRNGTMKKQLSVVGLTTYMSAICPR